MKITQSQLDDLISRLYDISNLDTEIEVRTDYSGRGMYDTQCVGFTTDNPVKLHGAICAILAESTATAELEAYDSDFEGIDWYRLQPSTDGMGLSSILYYRNLQVTD